MLNEQPQPRSDPHWSEPLPTALCAAAQRIAEEIKEMDPSTRLIDKLNRQFTLQKSLVGALG
jgi:hypothetical protein